MRTLAIALAMSSLTVLVLICEACDTNSEGWEDAEPLEIAMVSNWGENENCMGSDKPAPVISLARRNDGTLHLQYEACFPCDWHIAFSREKDGKLEVLLRRKFEHPNACGSARYTVRTCLGLGEVGDEVTIYRQEWIGDPIRKLATATAQEEADECQGLIACSAELQCEHEGAKMDEMGDYTMRCTEVDVCGGSFCIWDGEACMLECCEEICDIDKSFPAKLSCTSDK